MLATRTLLAGLLLGAPCAGLAQTFPRYYLGLAAYSSDYQGLGGGYGQGLRLPVQVVAGYQLRPRLAVQVGTAYSYSASSFFGASVLPPAYRTAAHPYRFLDDGQTTQRNVSVALLARYTLTRQPSHRFQADVLGGFTLENRRYTYANTHTDIDSAQVVVGSYQESSERTQTDLLLTAGISPRYRLGRHLEAVLDVTLNKSLTLNATRFTGATALGLRYRFGGLR